ncbi:MAG: AAA-associated domain-containing protein [Rhizomicrobium sp.]
MLRLAEVEGGAIKLTHMGKLFAEMDLNGRKEISRAP